MLIHNTIFLMALLGALKGFFLRASGSAALTLIGL